MLRLCTNCLKEYEGSGDECPVCGYVQSSDRKRQVYHLPAGMILHDRYRIGRVLERGGFGSTYKAWDMKLGIFVVIKEYYPSGMVNRVPGNLNIIVLPASVKAYEHGKILFLEEARGIAQFILEENIIDIYDYFEENNTVYSVWEFLEGVLLADYLRKTKEGKLEVEEAVIITTQLACALEAVHSKGLIHRDVSPLNIIICKHDRQMQVKLIGFSLSCPIKKKEELPAVIFSAKYAPVERYFRNGAKRKYKQGPWTDVYAIGVLMYRMITGISPDDSVNRKIKDTVLYPHEIDSTIPINISKAIMKAMAVSRYKRFKNMRDFRRAIAPIRVGEVFYEGCKMRMRKLL